MNLIVVDGPNLYNMVAAELASLGAPAKAYLRDWFDVDRFASEATRLGGSPQMGTVIFHSERALGRGDLRLETETDAFWARQGANPNTSTMLVSLPGVQRETFEINCPNCNSICTTETKGEKGIDTSITTYLFETAGAWTSLYLIAKDVDYAPPVEALRRRGKRVFVIAKPSERITALERVAQSALPWPTKFIRGDFELAEILRPDGKLDRTLSEVSAPKYEVEIRPFLGSASIAFQVHFRGQGLSRPQIEEKVREVFGGAELAFGQDGGTHVHFSMELPGPTGEMWDRILAGRRPQPKWLNYVVRKK